MHIIVAYSQLKLIIFSHLKLVPIYLVGLNSDSIDNENEWG